MAETLYFVRVPWWYRLWYCCVRDPGNWRCWRVVWQLRRHGYRTSASVAWSAFWLMPHDYGLWREDMTPFWRRRQVGSWHGARVEVTL